MTRRSSIRVRPPTPGPLGDVGSSGPRSGWWRAVLSLVALTCLAAAVLAWVHGVLRARLQAVRHRGSSVRVERVLPACDNRPARQDVLLVRGPKGEKMPVYRCVRVRRGVARVVAVALVGDSRVNAHPPYGGVIRVLVGIDAATGRVRRFHTGGRDEVGVILLHHSETEGLGGQATGYAFRKQFGGRDLVGKDQSTDPRDPAKRRVWAVKKDNPAGFVDALSGATVTSRAVTEVVLRTLRIFARHRAQILAPPVSAAFRR